MKEKEKLERMVECYCITRFNKEYYTKREDYKKIYEKVLKKVGKLNLNLNISGYSKICFVMDKEILNIRKD